MKGYDVRIILKDFSPEIWRDLIIPKDMTFDELDNILKILWDFKTNQLSTFVVKPRNTLIIDKSRNSNIRAEYDSKSTIINDFFDKYPVIEYLYDFKDNWKFLIEINNEIEYDADYAHVHGFKCGYNPIEGCGGLWEFSELIFYTQNPDKKDSSGDYDELSFFKIDEVNNLLKNLSED